MLDMGVVLAHDQVRQAGHRHVRSRQRRADPRDADGRRPCGDGCSRFAARRLLWRVRGRSARDPVRGDVPGAHGRARRSQRDGTNVVGARLSVGHPPKMRIGSGSSASCGSMARARRRSRPCTRSDTSTLPRRRNSSIICATARAPDARGSAADEQGHRHPPRARRRSRPDARSARGRRQVVPIEAAAVRRAQHPRRAATGDRGVGHLAVGDGAVRVSTARRVHDGRVGVGRLGGGRARPGACHRLFTDIVDSTRPRRRTRRPCAGATCWSGTTRSSGASSRAIAARRSIRPGTASSRLRRSCARDPLRPEHRRCARGDRRRRPRGLAHRRVRDRRRQNRGHRRPHGRARCVARGRARGGRLEHGQGSRRGLRHRVRRPRRPRAEGNSWRVASLRGRRSQLAGQKRVDRPVLPPPEPRVPVRGAQDALAREARLLGDAARGDVLGVGAQLDALGAARRARAA